MVSDVVEAMLLRLDSEQQAKELDSCVWISAALSHPDNQRVPDGCVLFHSSLTNASLHLGITSHLWQRDLPLLRQTYMLLVNPTCTGAVTVTQHIHACVREALQDTLLWALMHGVQVRHQNSAHGGAMEQAYKQ